MELVTQVLIVESSRYGTVLKW